MRGRPKSPTLILVEQVSGVIDVSALAKAAGGPQALALRQVSLSAGGPGGRRTDTTVRLLETHPHFGGVRSWFACPQCQRRCGKLYATEAHPAMACRQCHGLEYFLQHRKSLSQAFWHWAGYHEGRRLLASTVALAAMLVLARVLLRSSETRRFGPVEVV